MIKKIVLHQSFELILLAIAIVIASSFAISKCNKKKEASTRASQEQVKDAPVTHFKDAAGTDHAENPVAEAQNYEALIDYYASVIDSQAKLLSVKRKSIKQVLSVGTISSGSVVGKLPSIDKKPLACPDSLLFVDKWFSGVASNDTGWHLSYQVKDSIVFSQYYKRKGWFSKQLFIDGYSLNSNTRIAGLSNIKITTAAKRFGFGPAVIVTYDGQKWRPQVGVGLQYNLIRF